MVNIYLVGFMGSGKTSVGRALARLLDANFLDLDERLVGHFGCPIHEVFADRGEQVFRAAESEELRRVAAGTGHVVATGGGAFVDAENRRVIDEAGGISVYLDLPWEILRRRLARDNGGRPLYESEAQARGLFERRVRHYRLATVTVGLSGSETPETAARAIAEAVREAPCAT